MEFVRRYKSITEAANILKLQNSGISNNLKGLSKHCGGFIFKYE